MVDLPTPDHVEKTLRALARETETALGPYGRADAYRWAYSGVDGVQSGRATGKHRNAPADPVPGQLAAAQQVAKAAGLYLQALSAVRRANRLLGESSGPELARGGRKLGRWERPRQAEIVEAREKQRVRARRGEGFGGS